MNHEGYNFLLFPFVSKKSSNCLYCSAKFGSDLTTSGIALSRILFKWVRDLNISNFSKYRVKGGENEKRHNPKKSRKINDA